MQVNEVRERVIGAWIEVHRHLGAGLLESAYEEALAYELTSASVAFARQTALKATHKGRSLAVGYRTDFGS